MTNTLTVKKNVTQWLHKVVIGLNLCPFASAPARANTIRMNVSKARSEQELIDDLRKEITAVLALEVSEIETSLLIIPDYLQDFLAFNQFLPRAKKLIRREGWEGIVQLANFHPDYQFSNTEPQARENLTNRAPYPILHILREKSLEDAIHRYPDTSDIYENNIERMENLSEAQCKALFPYLFK